MRSFSKVAQQSPRATDHDLHIRTAPGYATRFNNHGVTRWQAVQQSSGGGAIGPLMQGFSKPVNDLSRGCTVTDVIDTVLCTSVQALAASGHNPMSTAA